MGKKSIVEQWKRMPLILPVIGILVACVLVLNPLVIPGFAQDQAPAESEKKAEAKKTEELPNSSCIDCHNADILKLSKEELADQVTVDGAPAEPRPKPKYVTGELNLSIDEKKYAAGVHADTTCVTCHKDIAELPHKQRLAIVDCKECHDDSVESIKKSAHGDKAAAKGLGCTGCHDVHYGKGKSDYGKAFERQACVDCHKAYGMTDLEKQHKNLYDAKLHLKLDCMLCHSGKTAGVHNIPSAKTNVVSCESCHSKYTVLAKDKSSQSASWMANLFNTSFINGELIKRFGYVVGANRIPLLDTIIVLAFVAPFALPILHGGIRFLTRRKGPIHLPEEKIYLHPLLERIWHWVQAVAIVMLIITGVIIHWPEWFKGWFEWAVVWHNWFGWLTVISFAVWALYNIFSGRITHYLPKKGEIPVGMIRQARFYAYGIFKHEPHPYSPSETNKFNPLQKIAYLQFQGFLMPILLASGILYMYPDSFKGIIDAMGGIAVLATIHYILGGLFAAFLVAHIYLATTGETVGENFKAIITGYGVKSDHDDHHHA